jgi:hypothetical protein
MSRGRGRATLLGVVMIACSKSPEEKAKQARETIDSWKATVAAVDSARLARKVPEHFARDVRRAASDEIAKAASQAK